MEAPTHKEFPTRCRTQMPKAMLMLEERGWGTLMEASWSKEDLVKSEQ